jgi:hypothetical protein
VAQKLVKLRPNLHDPSRRLFTDDEISHLMTIGLPVRFRDRKRARKVWSTKWSEYQGQTGLVDRITHDCIFRASRTRMAFRMFPPQSSTIFMPASGGRSKPALRATSSRTFSIYTMVNVIEIFSVYQRSYLLRARCRYSHEQTTTLDRSNQFAGTVRT